MKMELFWGAENRGKLGINWGLDGDYWEEDED